MVKYIKGNDGRFAGSVGDGKTAVPTASDLPATPYIPPTAQLGLADLDAVYAAYTAAQTPQHTLDDHITSDRLTPGHLYADVRAAVPDAPDSLINEQYAALLDEAAHTPDPPVHAARYLTARVAQQHMVNDLIASGQFTELDPPGSQADQYTLGPDGRPTHVWYASYGSNLTRDNRFLYYLHGGTPEGSTKHHHGARNPDEPTGDIQVALPGTVYFASNSTVWQGGGPAFLDPDTPGHALSRAYRITAEQFDDVVLQENSGDPHTNPTPVDTITAIQNGQVTGSGMYGRLVHVGDYQGSPVFTFTSPWTVQDAVRGDSALTPEGTLEPIGFRSNERAAQIIETRIAKWKSRLTRTPQPLPAVDRDVYTNAPSDQYKTMIGRGLAELGLTDQQISGYFAGATGT